MTSSRSFYVALTLLCFSTFVAINSAQPLSQEDLRSLREYLLRREEQPQAEIAGEQEDIAEEPIAVQPIAEQPEEPIATPFSDSQEGIDDEQTSDQAVQIPAFNDEDELTTEQRAAKERKNRGNSTKSGEARDKSGWSSYRRPSIDTKKFYALKVVKAEKFRYGGNGPFYTEIGVVVTADDGSRFLIRRTDSKANVRCWGSIDCDNVVVISANQMTKNWELVATKEIEDSTLGDFVNSSKSVAGRNAAADAMMKLD